MNYAYFPGCKAKSNLPQQDMATKAVCEALGITLHPIEFFCCGWPIRDDSYLASVYSTAKNLALAATENLPILTPCKCCFGHFRHVQWQLKRSTALRETVMSMLTKEGLTLDDTKVFHLFTVLTEHVGKETVEAATRKNRLTGLQVACQYGCHALRPGHLTGFDDDPLQPVIFENLIQATGAEVADYSMRLECCGYPLWDYNPVMAEKLMRKKLYDLQKSTAQIMATGCSYCQIQFGEKREILAADFPPDDILRTAPEALLYVQLLGLALGLPPALLGLDGVPF